MFYMISNIKRCFSSIFEYVRQKKRTQTSTLYIEVNDKRRPFVDGHCQVTTIGVVFFLGRRAIFCHVLERKKTKNTIHVRQWMCISANKEVKFKWERGKRERERERDDLENFANRSEKMSSFKTKLKHTNQYKSRLSTWIELEFIKC